MKYLVMTKTIGGAKAGEPPPEQQYDAIENIVLPYFKMLTSMEKGNKVCGGTLLGIRGMAFIMDFPSHDEAGNFITSLPYWTTTNWEVIPLCSFQNTVDNIEKTLKMVKKR